MPMRAGRMAGLDRRTLLTILGPALAYPIAGVDPLMLNLNLPAVSNGLGIPASSVGLLAGASTLVVAATVLAVGNLGDRFGLKRILVGGLLLNIAVGLLCSLAPGYPALLAGRLLDGLSLAALLGVSLALVTTSVPRETRSTAIGVTMAIYTLMYGLTPLVGGWVVTTFGWRSLFLVTIPFALAALMLTLRFVESVPRHEGVVFDAWGAGLFGLALLGLVWGLGHAAGGFDSPTAWIPLGISALAVLLLVARERRAPSPALNVHLFARRVFTLAVVATIVTNLFASGLGTVIGQLGSYVLGMSPQAIGLLYVPGTLIVAAASVAAGRAVAARSARPVLVLGLLIVAISGLVMAATASPVMGVAVLALATWLSNLGGFVSGTAAADSILRQARPGQTGSVAAVQPAFAMTGYALGPTVVVLLLDVFFRHDWLADAAAKGLGVSDAQGAVNAVTGVVTATPGGTGYSQNLYALADGLSIGVDFTDGVRLTMFVLALAPLAAAVATFLLFPRRETPDHESPT